MEKLDHQSKIDRLLARYIANANSMTGKNLTAARMRPILEALGRPQDKFRVVHVAGTSGKTSTCYYLSELLRLSNQKVGLTVSPHIDSITERLQVGGVPISETKFIKRLKEVLGRLTILDFEPTYFELLVAMAFWHFACEKVDYAVIETGLGGTHDATNVVDSADKVTVITDIGLDHMHILGYDIVSIASQKAGIIQSGNQVFMHHQALEIMSVVEERIRQVGGGARLYIAKELNIDSLPLFQSRNWSLAKAAYDYICARDGLVAITNDQLAKAQRLEIPGRLNIYNYKDHLVIVDGAHNAQKMSALVSSLKQLYPQQQFVTIVSFKQRKDYVGLLPILGDLVSRIIATSFNVGAAGQLRAIEPQAILDRSKALGFSDGKQAAGLDEALDWAVSNHPKEPILITGSLYLAAQARAILGA